MPRLRDSGTPGARPSGARPFGETGAAGVPASRAACPICGHRRWARRQSNMGDCAHRDRGSQARCCSYSGACDPVVQPNGLLLPPVAATGLHAPLDSSGATDQAAAAGGALRARRGRTTPGIGAAVRTGGTTRRGRPNVADAPDHGHGALKRARSVAKARPSRPIRQRISRSPEDKDGWERHPANEMKPPTMVPYAMWAARLTSGVCGP